MNTSGLSLEQAPPISIPFKFFLTASVFSILVGLLIALHGESLLLSRWSPIALGVTHLVTIGFLAQVMTGAIVQLMPVLAGSPLPSAVAVSTVVHLGLVSGALLLVAGFILSIDWSLMLGALILVGAFSILLLTAGVALIRSKAYRGKALTLGIGWLALVPTLILAVLLVLAITGKLAMPDILQIVTLHASWGLLGWVGVIVFTVVIQLLPMFYVTPEFPSLINRWILPMVFILLMFFTFSKYIESGILKNGLLLAVSALALVAVSVLRMIRKRKRAIMDATLFFLWTGMASSLCAAVVWIANGKELLVGVFVLAGVCMTVPIGIIYKVIPFLCWFHLQSLQIKQAKFTYSTPSMKAFIPERSARLHYVIHLLAYCCLLIAVWYPMPFAHISGVVLTLSSSYFFVNILKANMMYRREQHILSVAIE